MIKEAYVSFEVAKLLKEKGFDGDCENECHMFYHEMTDRIMPIMEIGMVPGYDDVYFAPTQQMAMAWLREKGIHMSIDTVISSKGNIYFNIDTYSEDSGWNHPVDFYNSYEEAVEAALKYTLVNLI